MGLFKKPESDQNGSKTDLESQMRAQAVKLGISYEELKTLAQGKSCPKYGTAELLHARKTRGGKIAVFNISEKFRGEKISSGRKNISAKKAAQNSESTPSSEPTPEKK